VFSSFSLCPTYRRSFAGTVVVYDPAIISLEALVSILVLYQKFLLHLKHWGVSRVEYYMSTSSYLSPIYPTARKFGS